MPADDPYRTLGLERGASLDEVKRAYRRLAKSNHPDAAGEAALPRFLAIQDAYDRIVGPEPGNGRGPAPRTPAGPWQADSRSGRRDVSRLRRTTAAATGATDRSAPWVATSRLPPPRPPSARLAPAPPRALRAVGRLRRASARKKATLGSTSYDDVDPEAFSPDWGGASHGTTSGTYWTINPKEYADPRKHGPEYQARARRAGQARPPGLGEAPVTARIPRRPRRRSPGTRRPMRQRAPRRRRRTRHPRGGGDSRRAGHVHRRGRTCRPDERAAACPPRTRRADDAVHDPTQAAAPPATDYTAADLSTDAVMASIRGWLDDDQPTGIARIGRAVIGWAPIALGAGWFAGEVSGCGRFAATCPPLIDPLTWVVQLGTLLLLILLPRLARITTIGTIAILGTVFPASLLLFATGDPEGMAFGRSARWPDHPRLDRRPRAGTVEARRRVRPVS